MITAYLIVKIEGMNLVVVTKSWVEENAIQIVKDNPGYMLIRVEEV